MIRRRGQTARDGAQGRSKTATHRLLQLLFCALALAIVSGSLLWAQPANAATHATFYGISSSRMVAALGTDTATATDTPTATATSTPTSPPAATATPSNPYALDVSGAASASGWPQAYSNWCGIATVALIANYLGNSISQSAIAGMLNNPANQSMWSYPAPSSAYWGPYVPANISGDFGTDPRSLAKGMTLATGRIYHAKVDTSGAWDTTIHIVRDMLVSKQPISVFVDHGMHSVVVSGVEATGDPLSNPNSITAIHVWDPGGGVNSVGIQPTLEAVVPISQWLSGTIPWSGSVYLKYPYAANVYQGRALDPDPAVGPYAYVPLQDNHLWIGHNVYISPLASSDSANLSPDWELDQYGTLIAGLPGGNWPNLPDGYTGASVPMPSNPPPPPPPVKPPVLAPKLPPPPPPRPTPTARPTFTMTPMATATSLPTVAPTATAQPQAACAPFACALTAVQKDTGLLLITLLFLLLLVMWFPAAIMVARLRSAREQMSKEEMLQAMAAQDLAANDAPTLAELLDTDKLPVTEADALVNGAASDAVPDGGYVSAAEAGDAPMEQPAEPAEPAESPSNENASEADTATMD
jgi:hypothetical protein